MISVCREFVHAAHYLAVTELVDSFGTKFIVQTPILEQDHAAAVEQAKSEMQAREDALIAKLKAAPFSYSEEKIQAMQKSPQDCGCK